MKKILKFIVYTFAGFVLAIAAYLLCAWLFKIIPVNTSFQEPRQGVEIYIKSNGVHTDLVVPAKDSIVDWKKSIQPKYFRNTGKEVKYISFGWGDKGFFLYTPTWADLKYSTAFKALFWLSSAAMHVTYYDEVPRENEHTRKLIITPAEYKLLVRHISRSFRKDAENNYIAINCCHYKNVNDNFFEANGTYNLFYTCNSWTNEGLKKAGIKTAVWAPFESSVMYHLKK